MLRLNVLLSFLVLTAAPCVRGAPPDQIRGTPVEWARLRTDSPYWDRHADFDEVLLDFMRHHTSLDIDPVMHTASADSLAELCTYPFIFVANAESLTIEEDHHLGEYLRRGGFLLMDLCLEPKVHPDIRAAIMNEVGILHLEFPHLVVKYLPSDHDVYKSYFDLSERRKAQEKTNAPGESADKTQDRIGFLAGAYDGNRMIAILSMSGFQCDLAGFDRFASPTGAAQMLTNIYVYALAGDRNRPSPPSP